MEEISTARRLRGESLSEDHLEDFTEIRNSESLEESLVYMEKHNN
jgi:hypothetical protein